MKVKQINKKADDLLITWLKSIVSDEEQEQINHKNYKQFLPKEEYIQKFKTYYLAMYTQRWTKQNIKKLLKLNYKLEDITIKHLEKLTEINLADRASMSSSNHML